MKKYMYRTWIRKDRPSMMDTETSAEFTERVHKAINAWAEDGWEVDGWEVDIAELGINWCAILFVRDEE